jgi:sugar transferase (PEP-CTERM system associated)
LQPTDNNANKKDDLKVATFKLFNNHLKTTFLLLALMEATIFFASVYVAIGIRFNSFDFNSPELLTVYGAPFPKAVFFMVLHVLGMIALGQYQAEQYRGKHSFTQMVTRVVVSMLLVSFAMIIFFFILPSTQMGRGVTLLAVSISMVCIITLRQVFFHSIDGNLFNSRVLVFGTGDRAASLIEDQNSRHARTYQIRGFIATPSQIRVVPSDMIIELDEPLLQLARKLDINEIILAMDDRRREFPTQHLLDCKMAGISIIDPVSFLEREQGKVNLKLMNPSWMIYSDGFTASRFKAFISRTFDLIASISILVITFPILLLTAFLISLESGFKEPIFYRQVRVGLDGKQFNLLKFRSMSVNAERDGAVWATQNDARVTRVGSVIRKCRIDELPQILNILKGDMRLVGPRPERPEFVNKLSQSIAMYTQRHSVKPGLAGWAQLKYPYGASEADAYEKLQYDLFYIKNSNLVMDIFILLQTLEVVIFGKGAR